MPETPSPLSSEERRWLHDKFEHLAAEESQLASTRTTYYAAIGTVLVTALVVAIADFVSLAAVLVLVVTFLSLLGILISLVWVVLLHRTNDAKNLWRDAATRLEEELPPLAGEWMVPISLRSTATVRMNLLRPFQAHAARFSATRSVSWMDRANPDRLTEVLPMAFFGIWVVILGSIWVWFLVLR